MTIAKSIEFSAESRESFDHAIKEGLQKARQSVKHLRSAWIENQQLELNDDGSIKLFRVWMKATFIVE
jgi:flavin-binding protein dodecin